MAAWQFFPSGSKTRESADRFPRSSKALVSRSAHEPRNEGNDKEYQEQEEKNLGYGRCGTCKAAESKKAGNQSHDQEYEGVIQHGDLLCHC